VITVANGIKASFWFQLFIITENVAPEQLENSTYCWAHGPFISQFISDGATNKSTKFYKEK
jgi:hypothetical protein